MANVRAGSLRRRIRIEKKTAADDGQGGSTFTWTLHATPWAEPDELGPQADVYGGAVVDATVTRFKLRYVAGVTVAMRVVYGSRTYNIEGIRNVQHRDRRLELICREVRDGSS